MVHAKVRPTTYSALDGTVALLVDRVAVKYCEEEEDVIPIVIGEPKSRLRRYTA